MTKGSIQTLLSESHLVVGSYKIELPVNNDPKWRAVVEGANESES